MFVNSQMDTPDVALAQAGAVGAEAEPQGSPHHSNPTTCPATVPTTANGSCAGCTCVAPPGREREEEDAASDRSLRASEVLKNVEFAQNFAAP